MDPWGTTWTPADINASNFGVALSANSVNNRTAYVDYMQISVTYTVTVIGSTTTVNCGGENPVGTYGTAITCVATVVRGSGLNTPTGNVSWVNERQRQLRHKPVRALRLGGTATCSVTYTPSSVGTGSHLITANYAGDQNFYTSTGNQTVTVNKASSTVTVTVGILVHLHWLAARPEHLHCDRAQLRGNLQLCWNRGDELSCECDQADVCRHLQRDCDSGSGQ